MKRTVSLFLLFMTMMSANAQSHQSIRDSLSEAIRLTDLYPDSVELKLKKASWNMMLKEWQRAKDEYDNVLQLDPLNAAALYFRAYANEQMRRYSFARADYEKLLQLLPQDFRARLGLALLNQKDNRTNVAYDQMNQLVTQFPDSALAYAARGGLEMAQDMMELAEYDYSRAIELEPTNTDFLINRVAIRIMLGRKKEAREDLDRMVQLGVSRANLLEYYRRVK